MFFQAPTTRIRHNLVRREIAVQSVEHVTPKMLRLVLAGPALEGFASAAPDDHIKIFVPCPDGSVAARNYTPRRYDRTKCALTLDFALHEAGPVTQWAMQARAGDVVTIAGPKGSLQVRADLPWYLLAGDETALPAVGRWLEEMPASAQVFCVLAVQSAAEEQRLTSHARVHCTWVHRPANQTAQSEPLLAAVRQLTLPPDKGFVWLAGEVTVVRALRQHILHERQHPHAYLKAGGYWRAGDADAHEKFG